MTAALAWQWWHVFYGDPAIYLGYSQNALEGRLWQFNAGEFSSGVASPLWSVFLAAFLQAGPYALKWAGLAGLLFSLAAVLFSGWTRGLRIGQVGIGWLLLVHPLAHSCLMGYESGLLVGALSLCMARWKRPGWGVFFAALAALARPEAALALACIWLASLGEEESREKLLQVVAATAATAASLGMAWALSGHVWQSAASRRLAGLESTSEIWGLVYSPVMWATMRQEPWSLALVLALVGAVVAVRAPRSERVSFPLLLAAGAILFVFVVPVGGWPSRYLLLLHASSCLMIARLLAEPPRVQWQMTVALLAAALGGRAAWNTFRTASAEARLGFTAEVVFNKAEAARLNAMAPQGAKILVFEVQMRAALRKDLRVRSLDGLTDATMNSVLAGGSLVDYLRRERPNYWILDQSVDRRRHLRGSILANAAAAIRSGQARYQEEGISFEVISRTGKLGPPGYFWPEAVCALSFTPSRGSSLSTESIPGPPGRESPVPR